MPLKLNLAEAQVLSEALVQYLEGAAGQGVEGGNAIVAERLLKQLSAYMADADQLAAERASENRAAFDQEKMGEALREQALRQAQERRERHDRLISERAAAEEADRERHQEIMRKQIALFAKPGRVGR